MPAPPDFAGGVMQFQDLMYQNVVMPGSASTQQTVSSGLQVGLGTRSAATEVLQNQGDFTSTGNQLDLAIQGNGFFQVTLPNGQTAYTRSGGFQLDSQGNMVTTDGNPLVPAIAIPNNATNVTIGSDGTVTVSLPGRCRRSRSGRSSWRHFQSRWLEQRGQQSVFTDDGFRRPDRGRPRRQQRAGNLAARDARAVQRQPGERVRADDSGAALV